MIDKNFFNLFDGWSYSFVIFFDCLLLFREEIIEDIDRFTLNLLKPIQVFLIYGYFGCC
jgi:hypothetical protein